MANRFQKLTSDELGLLITGLQSVTVADKAIEQHKLQVELETALAGNHGMMIGSWDQQARNQPAPKPLRKVKSLG